MTTSDRRKGLLASIAARRWAMERRALTALSERACDPPSPREGAAKSGADLSDLSDISDGYYRVGNAAVIEVAGVMLKSVPAWFEEYGIEASGMRATQLALEEALRDPAVSSVFLLIDSPGGEVAGTQELGDAVFAARGRGKPIHAHISDLGASAAYWVAAQADSISANETAALGSIGVYGVMYDFSTMFEQAGVRTIVVASGPYKGAGVFGAEITDDQLLPIREEINGLMETFVGAVSRGRGMDAAMARELATGRVWLAKEALGLRLIDRIENSDEALERAQKKNGVGPAFAELRRGARVGESEERGAGRDEEPATGPEPEREEDAMKFFGRKKDASETPPADEQVVVAEADEETADPEPAQEPAESVETDEAGGAVEPAPAGLAMTPSQFAKLSETVGDAFATEAFKKGMTETEAILAHHGVLQARVKDLEAKLSALGLGEEEAASFSDADPKGQARAAATSKREQILGPHLAKAAVGYAEKLEKMRR